MTLNPIQFGRQVIAQYGRYMTSNFPIADPSLSDQFKKQVEPGLDGERFLVKGPYVYLSRSFAAGPTLDELLKELDLHPALKSVLPFQRLHKHQEDAVRAIKNNKNVIMTTGTGSGKTEGFLLPIIDYCLKLRDSTKTLDNSGVVAILIYPMNALVNDQLKRLRKMLAGTGITFGRFTSETPDRKSESTSQLEFPRQYTKEEKDRLDSNPKDVPFPWEECVSEEDIRERKPRLILTNYKQLEYLLSRPNDFKIFKNAPLKFIVIDEIHTYTGALGSEMACLTRRIKHIVSKNPQDIVCIGTSATVAPNTDEEIISTLKNFGARFFGSTKEEIDIVREIFLNSQITKKLYEPPALSNPQQLLERILDKSREYQLQDDVVEISADFLQLAQELCSKELPGVNNMTRLYGLLKRNRLLADLENFFQHPRIFDEVLPILRSHKNREAQSDEDLAAEVLSYLILGAIAKFDEESLLKPKIHYFVRGLQGLWCTIDSSQINLLIDEKDIQEQANFSFPLAMCQSCGQHYFKVFADNNKIALEKNQKAINIRKTRSVMNWQDSPHQGEKEIYLTDRLVSKDEELSVSKQEECFVCLFCGTLHSEKIFICQNESCGRSSDLHRMLVWEEKPSKCAACGTGGTTYPTIRESISRAVSDITILAQDMLASMSEEKFQKLLIFADNRQEAAHQAGWMKKRSERFRIRHLLYQLLHEDPNRIWSFNALAESVLEVAISEGILPNRAFDKDGGIRVRWILLEEFGTTQRKKGNIENLGLAEIKYDGIGSEINSHFIKWSQVFNLEDKEIQSVIHAILDYCRRRNTLSDSLLSRIWNPQDLEVRKGLIGASDYQKRLLLTINAPQDKIAKTYAMGWIGRDTAIQLIVKKSNKNNTLKSEELSTCVNDFLRELWEFLKKRELLVESTLKAKRYGSIKEIKLPVPTFKLNIEKIGVCETKKRYICTSCNISSTVPLPTMKCSQYRCNGVMKESERNEDDYDVVRYTKLNSVPLKPFEHTAQIPKEDRERVENEFKKTHGRYNCIVASPTLELGVDIGALDMVLMRNTPPAPVNYSQRAGRAGRRHRIAVVFTYTGMSNHDKYFFKDPPTMISGNIRIPTFSMQNNVIIRKHVHSTILTCLLELCKPHERSIISKTFPTYIWSYFLIKSKDDNGTYRKKYLEKHPSFLEFKELIMKYRSQLLEKILDTFTKEWPTEDSHIVDREKLEIVIDGMPHQLEEHVSKLFNQVKTYRRILSNLTKDTYNIAFTYEEKKLVRKYQNALDKFSQQDQFTYTLTYLSNDGFFPGYGLTREHYIAKCLDPYQEIIRPPPVALREMTPASKIYANMNIFEVIKVDFYGPKKDNNSETVEPFEIMGYDKTTGQIFQRPTTMEGAEENSIKIESAPMHNVELEQKLAIDDRKDYRFQITFEIQGILLNKHTGGHEGMVGNIKYRYLKREGVRLVNAGPKKLVLENKLGFPTCRACGQTRNPFASDIELNNFESIHQKSCKIEKINNLTFHIDIISDVLCLGPYQNNTDATNMKEAVLNRSRSILDMSDMELEGFVIYSNEEYWTVLYDPTPGGSGLLPQIIRYWRQIVEDGVRFHNNCTCKQSCYSCMRNYRNQPHHDILDRHKVVELLAKVSVEPHETTIIPQVTVRPPVNMGSTDSNAEQKFLSILTEYGFPIPELQYRVDFDGGFTVADFAYIGDSNQQSVLIFIDGLSKEIHGNPETQRRDRLKRAKLRMEGFNVLESSAEGLRDEKNLELILQELELYLKKYQS